MRLILIQSPDAFGVYDDDVDRLALCGLAGYSPAPTPQALGAWVDSRTHSEAIAPIEQHTVEQIGLASPVHAGDGDYRDGPADFANEGSSFLA